ncbi:MAG: helix-turn-helix domain-containing protein [Prevotella sp.]|nr:helix-turn-helix domain-containing protein [Prevotella sp.]
MNRRLKLKLLAAALLLTPTLRAQTAMELHRYDETNSALEGHTTQILQDRQGFLWISTWNGIYRFDGYEFRRIKPHPDDDCSMTSDRIRDIWLAKNGDIYVRNDETLFYFSTTTYHFRNLNGEEEQREAEQQRDDQPTRGQLTEGRVEYTDPQGLQWRFYKDALYCMSRVESPAQPIPIESPAIVHCLEKDSKKRVWMGTKEDTALRLLDQEGRVLGFIRPDGTLSPSYCSFGHAVYSMTETRDGHIWIGTKPDGLFRLTEISPSRFTVEHLADLQNASIYGIAEDRQGRLWISTLGDGIACIENPGDSKPTVVWPMPGFPTDKCQRVRHIHITPQGFLLAATTEGLLVGKAEANARDSQFRLVVKDPNDSTSLSCNAVMDIVETYDNRIFVCTETGGISEIVTPDLTAEKLQFRRYDIANGLLPTDMTIAMTLTNDNHLIVTSTTKVVNIDLAHNTFESLGHHFFHHVYHFSEVRPLMLDGDWLFGTLEGAFLLPANSAQHSNYQPPLHLTSVTFSDNRQMLAVTSLDTLRLAPDERSVTIQFAALDYVDPQVINYQYMLETDSPGKWINLGQAHSITLPELAPGTYRLSVRSTNAERMWTNNTRTLVIIAEPAFWETLWFRVLVALAVLAVIGGIVYTVFYIKAINRRQHETLAKYLALLEEKENENSPSPLTHTLEEEGKDPLSDPFMQRVLAFVEQNLDNSGADIGQMADACAVSRSVLQRKMKQLMGVTPVDFLREARLKRACQMLRSTDLTVSEVAYRCGFSDPKYFSRCFKQSIGLSPTEYKGQAQLP